MSFLDDFIVYYQESLVQRDDGMQGLALVTSKTGTYVAVGVVPGTDAKQNSFRLMPYDHWQSGIGTTFDVKPTFFNDVYAVGYIITRSGTRKL